MDGGWAPKGDARWEEVGRLLPADLGLPGVECPLLATGEFFPKLACELEVPESEGFECLPVER